MQKVKSDTSLQVTLLAADGSQSAYEFAGPNLAGALTSLLEITSCTWGLPR